MSDFKWLVCELSDREYENIVPLFNEVIEANVLTIKQKEILRLSENHSEQLIPKFIPKELLPKEYDKKIYKNGIIDAEKLRLFSSVFALEKIDQVFYKLPLNEKNVIQFSVFDEYPFTILSYSLGLREAAKIPGLYGNIMIKYKELNDSLNIVKAIMDKKTTLGMSKARKIYSCCNAGVETTQFDNEINEIFSFLPSAFEKAIKRKANIICLSFWMG